MQSNSKLYCCKEYLVIFIQTKDIHKIFWFWWILIKIYLIEYTITKFKIPKEINDFRIPSKEKTSRESPLIEITELSFCISLENVIGEWYKFSPICLIESDISEFKLIIWSHRKNEKFIQIPKTINLKINFEGFSTDVTPKWEKSNLKP